ncbi:MAG: uracil-DNA glycosylase family protein [Bacteroidota bacterium]|uniref:uracil-DNA glycosylase family protein n=1 Tax=Leeuwenhoekiella palythoae TaxID=573501 RepID=UPI001CE1A5A4|nr:uracil-DNA glycosylase family protein [Leeuwenhoekiella palythoae]MEC7781823.1 uracil-DNA glycosylase family protein [Bacteroidota bacterium]MEE3149064.1 uracil-DNA glycosylase family protein [Bacteroidota bacterium]MEE3226116.1 uracil-DNA glycosylase family protein [Bacteroidota bacterium]MEE3245147.1 uracil-DNA glycosylase family protein [Bacteroidota bacterium]UBZ10677.1 uracil-DNA glycosylase family protein [Leeuwenhoekiella palythoae]
MKGLLTEIRQCSVCKPFLPLGANPIISASPKSKIVLASQAPGKIAHEKSIAWDDPSGRRLRDWLGVDEDTFYNFENFAILPLGFCFPGKGKTGDLPPRPECAPLWHKKVTDHFEADPLYILIGNHSQRYYLNDNLTLTARIKAFESYLPQHFVLPHPSPVNRFWMAKNKWFETDVLPVLQRVVGQRLA